MKKIFDRQIYDELKHWKDVCTGTCLIESAPGVGKTTVALEFAKSFSDYIYIDFKNTTDRIRSCFKNHMGKNFYIYFSAATNHTITDDTLVILDNVDYFPRGRECMQTFAEDAVCRWLATGSFTSIPENVENIRIPADQTYFTLKPLSFFEFLKADGWEIIAEALSKIEDFEPWLHDRVLGLYSLYMFVGGMPSVVDTFINTHDLNKTEIAKEALLEYWQASLKRWANKNLAQTEKILHSIPKFLSRKNPEFCYQDLGYETELDVAEGEDLLIDAKMVDPSLEADALFTTFANIPCKIPPNYVLYLEDTGLLFALNNHGARVENTNKIADILWGNWQIDNGIYLKNACAQALATHEVCGRSSVLTWWTENKTDVVPFLMRNWTSVSSIGHPLMLPIFIDDEPVSIVDKMREAGADVWKPVILGNKPLCIEKRKIDFPIYALETLPEFVDRMGYL